MVRAARGNGIEESLQRAACNVQPSCDLQILAGDWGLMTGDVA